MVKIFRILRGSPKYIYSYFGGCQMFELILFDSMLFFGPSFSHLMCYFGYFSEIQWHFSKLKKGSLVQLIWVKKNLDNSCFQSILSQFMLIYAFIYCPQA